MVKSIINTVLKNGVKNCSKIILSPAEKTQIAIYKNSENNLNYAIYHNWHYNQNITFKQFLNKKVDILGYEKISKPFLIESIDYYQKKHEHQIQGDNISLFILLINDKVKIAAFGRNKHLEIATLDEHLKYINLH